MPREQWHTTTAYLSRKLNPQAKTMRHAPTAAEQRLWQALRNQALGVRFRRQHVIDQFIVDFCCLKEKLVVEVDGAIHRTAHGRDALRDGALNRKGFHVLRFTNEQVMDDLASVIAEIRRALGVQPLPHTRLSTKSRQRASKE